MEGWIKLWFHSSYLSSSRCIIRLRPPREQTPLQNVRSHRSHEKSYHAEVALFPKLHQALVDCGWCNRVRELRQEEKHAGFSQGLVDLVDQ